MHYLSLSNRQCFKNWKVSNNFLSWNLQIKSAFVIIIIALAIQLFTDFFRIIYLNGKYKVLDMILTYFPKIISSFSKNLTLKNSYHHILIPMKKVSCFPIKYLSTQSIHFKASDTPINLKIFASFLRNCFQIRPTACIPQPFKNLMKTFFSSSFQSVHDFLRTYIHNFSL